MLGEAPYSSGLLQSRKLPEGCEIETGLPHLMTGKLYHSSSKYLKNQERISSERRGMGFALDLLCQRYSGLIMSTAPTAIRLWDTFYAGK